jgi:hypothetical protein
MGFMIFLVVMFIFITMVRNAAQKVKEAKIVLPPDFFGTQNLPPEHVRHVGGGAAIESAPGMVSAPAMISARAMGEESSSEQLADETAYDHDLNLDHAEVVSLEQPSAGMSVAPRPIPVRPTRMETEVDWTAEHDRFHKRYVDVKAPPQAAAHGLLDALRDPAGARRAVLLAEILGPPVSMRR